MRHRKYASMADRLLANSRPDPLTGCRIWTGKQSKRRSGGLEGRINVRVNGRHKSLRAHRVSFETFNGPIPEGLQIDHTCVNSLCIEPTHLEAVTNAENQRRRIERMHEESDAAIRRGNVEQIPNELY